MSTNPENRLVLLISRWLARHVGDDALVAELDAVDPADLAPGQAEAVAELREAFRAANGRGQLEMIARETLEALALGA